MAAYSNIFLVAVFVLLAHSANGFCIKEFFRSGNDVRALYNISVLKFDNPAVQLEELNLLSNVNQQMVYTLGTRMPGDQIVGHVAKNVSYHRPHTFGFILVYPRSGAPITYVYIVVNQATKLGRAVVIKGGIHQRLISVIIDAYDTAFVNIDAIIYGMA